MKTECPFCGQHYEVDEQSLNQVASCSTCGKEFVIQPRSNISSAQTSNWKNNSSQANVKQGALIGAGICLLLALSLHFVTNFLFLLYAPLYLAAFVLSIVALAQKRILGGILLLASSIVSPFLIMGINLVRFAEENRKATQRIESVNASASTTRSDTPRQPKHSPSTQSAFVKPELPGLCGVMFASKFQSKSASPAGTLTDGRPFYAMSLENYFMEFKDVSVLITPKTELIYAIWMSKSFERGDLAEAEMEKVKAVLEDHYKCQVTKQRFTLDPTYVFKFNNATITLRAKRLFSSGAVEIIAVDDKLQKQAEEEAKEIAIEKTDTSVL